MNIKRITLGILLAASTSSTFCGLDFKKHISHITKKDLLTNGAFTAATIGTEWAINWGINFGAQKFIGKEVTVKQLVPFKVFLSGAAALGLTYVIKPSKYFVGAALTYVGMRHGLGVAHYPNTNVPENAPKSE